MTTHASAATPRAIPLRRITTTETRKMLDTRSGLWLMASIGLLALLTTSAVILWAARDELTYSTFVSAISIPMTLVIPMVAILSVTGEWSQRSGLTTFTLVPHRSRVITAKALACLSVAGGTIPFAFAVGALGNIVGTAIAGVDPVWDLTVTNLLTIMLANVLAMMVGFMLGVVIRSSAAALAAYFVYQFLLPTLALLLASAQQWFRDLQPWVDFDYAQSPLLKGALTSQQWVQLLTTGAIWLVLPMAVGLVFMVRAEVK
jgi:ABC-2 type transport system permease protein